MERIRCFIAIDFDKETKDALSKLQHDVLKLGELNALKAVGSDTLHVTMNFLGAITPSEATKISDALRSIKFHPFCVTLTGVGALPSLKNMRVIYVGFAPSTDLTALNARILAVLPEQYQPKREFNPHVTLARVKKRIPEQLQQLAHDIEAAAAYQVCQYNVTSFQLKKSTLTRQGPVYETLEEFWL